MKVPNGICIILFLILLQACCASKRTISQTSENTNEVIVAENSTPEPPVPPTPPKVAPPVVEEVEEIEETITDEIKEAFDHTEWNSLLTQHVSSTGQVNYKGFKSDRVKLKVYLDQLSIELPNDNWTKEDELAYWMNAYNAFTVKLIIDNYPVKSIKDIKDPWDARFFKMGDRWRNLNEIEHKILRKMGDARIHFGINCASFSCPTIHNKAFTAANVNETLDELAKNFINDKRHNEISANQIKLSKIFQWFAKDFKENGSLIDFLNQYSEIKINKNARKSFKKYNWTLNE